MARNKAKVSDKDYTLIFSELSKELTSLDEVNSVLGKFAEKLDVKDATALKSGLARKSTWRFTQLGDDSWINRLNEIGWNIKKPATLEEELTQFPKAQIITWLNEIIEYKNNDMVLQNTKDDENYQWYLHLLANHIKNDLNTIDRMWFEHRIELHKPSPDANALLVLMLALFSLLVAINFFATGGIILWTYLVGITGFLLTYPLSILKRNYSILNKKEKALVGYTEIFFNKYPKELWNVIFGDGFNKQDYHAEKYSLFVLRERKPWFRTPIENSPFHKLAYKLSKANLIDIEGVKNGTLPTNKEIAEECERLEELIEKELKKNLNTD